jgi:hypothetical protein
MKLIKSNREELNERKQVQGLLACEVEYEVKAAKGRLEYSGPKFAPEMWHQIMSFFRWTHAEMHSESQVRLYVNEKLGRWGAWAFPQEARTGMTARELPVQETPEKAEERFASWNSEPSDDWLYFGTVHHHCSASAFQSSTDERNEWNQDGLHITIGRVDSDRRDLHARFYLAGNCFEPDMSLFWPIESELAAKLPRELHDELARFQMSERIDIDFPSTWRANIVEVESARRNRPSEERDWNLFGPQVPHYECVEGALEEIAHRCAGISVAEDQWVAELQALSGGAIRQIIIESCLRNGLTPKEIFDEMSQCTFGF